MWTLKTKYKGSVHCLNKISEERLKDIEENCIETLEKYFDKK